MGHGDAGAWAADGVRCAVSPARRSTPTSAPPRRRESAPVLIVVAFTWILVMVPPLTRTRHLYGKGFATATPVSAMAGAVCTPVAVAVATVSPVVICAVVLPVTSG